MPDTYTQCCFHLVFAVKNRNALIMNSWKNDLERYITGIVQNQEHKILAVGAMPDHIHIGFGYNINHLVPDLVGEIKTSSNAWIKQNQLSVFSLNICLISLTMYQVWNNHPNLLCVKRKN